MSWKSAAALLVIVFVLTVLQAVLAAPLVETTESLNASGDYSNEHFDGNELITGYASSWFDMGLVAIFGMMLWAVARVVRRELTRRQRGP